ncbi:MAG TPA: RNA polymerase sigma factor [Opitutaceae bacterium]|jgi:RNA polymerase sigma factor (sigma-70 family)
MPAAEKPPSELSQLCADIDDLYRRQTEAGITGLSRELALGLLRWAGAAAWAVKGGGAVNAQDREDAAQNAFVAIQQNLGSYRQVEAFHAWAMKIIANKVTDIIRRKTVRGEMTVRPDEPEGGWVHEPDNDERPDRAAARRDDLERIREISDELQDRETNRAFRLRYVVGLKLAEIAPILGCSTAQAHKLAERGRDEIREKIAEHRR